MWLCIATLLVPVIGYLKLQFATVHFHIPLPELRIPVPGAELRSDNVHWACFLAVAFHQFCHGTQLISRPNTGLRRAARGKNRRNKQSTAAEQVPRYLLEHFQAQGGSLAGSEATNPALPLASLPHVSLGALKSLRTRGCEGRLWPFFFLHSRSGLDTSNVQGSRGAGRQQTALKDRQTDGISASQHGCSPDVDHMSASCRHFSTTSSSPV